ncbi:hypothetical protein [Flavobacterium reichenbachii]|uniref:Uncharacterized protein n=1 Tax=Flavobacterium reichenbachii TaxID=362418 RepID=A0A085ZG67_9FLAO|nr:hypothetical protein [Flavobacterium reichenbachii]KFF03431.1 hypothetical protein IW19_21315 [Flavobacterium reichenbachii]OXB16792.1 hypothetical protein B0A68_06600 [Flavobacterium reichenbachii]
MFITLTPDRIHFEYGSKRWQYNFEEIAELGLLKKKKTYFLENGAFILVTVLTNYFLFFSDFMELYYIIPALLLYTVIVISRFHNTIEFEYFVIVRDVYQKEIRVKIKALDRVIIGKEIDHYLSLEFDRVLQLNKSSNFKIGSCA